MRSFVDVHHVGQPVSVQALLHSCYQPWPWQNLCYGLIDGLSFMDLHMQAASPTCRLTGLPCMPTPSQTRFLATAATTTATSTGASSSSGHRKKAAGPADAETLPLPPVAASVGQPAKRTRRKAGIAAADTAAEKLIQEEELKDPAPAASKKARSRLKTAQLGEEPFSLSPATAKAASKRATRAAAIADLLGGGDACLHAPCKVVMLAVDTDTRGALAVVVWDHAKAGKQPDLSKVGMHTCMYV